MDWCIDDSAGTRNNRGLPWRWCGRAGWSESGRSTMLAQNM
jgi:hypothetical protein